MYHIEFSTRAAANIFCTLLASTLLCGPLQAAADSRREALEAISILRMNGLDVKRADEMRSLEATFATAESYFEARNAPQSEEYYLLTIQKAMILESEIQHKPAPQTPETPPSSPAAAKETPHPATTPADPENASTSASKVDEISEPSIPADIVSDKLVGKESSYTVVKGDTLRLIAAKLGVRQQQLLTVNRLDPKATLKIGQTLKYNNRKIIPKRMKEGIVVNIPDRTLYYFKQGKLVRSMPVALGTAKKNEKYDWQTPTGKFRIIAKQTDPTWNVPPSIQSEMEDEGKEVIISIPPGPENPLGKYAIKTSLPGIMIHSTIKPWSIYSFASHGCIRVFPAHMEEFFKEVKVNTPGEIIYKPVKLAVTIEGRIFLEVHQDIYSRSSGLSAEAKKLIEGQKLSELVDWKKFETVVNQKSGVAHDITMQPAQGNTRPVSSRQHDHSLL